MKKFDLYSSLNDEAIAGIVSCVDKIEELVIDAHGVKKSDLKILSTAINNRTTPVS